MEVAFGFAGVGVELREVAGTAGNEGMGKRPAGDLFEGSDHFEDGGGATGAEIVGGEAGLQTANSGEVAASEVDDVDVVAKTGTVGCFVIVAKNMKLREFAGGDFHDVRHEVVRDAVGVLAEETGDVVADGIEITKSDDVELGVGYAKVFQDFFDHVFGLAVGVGKLDTSRKGFDALLDTLVAINSGGGGENEPLHIVGLHRLEEVEGAGDVVVVVLERLFDGFGDGFEAGEMDDKVKMGMVENLVEG